ncbi:MAG: DUF4160 domain-containing protein [Bacteroidota bacterium]
MPEVSRFYGIVIRMYFDDHPPPHFHAEYGEHEVLYDVANLRIFSGSLPHRAMKMVEEWSALHQNELLEVWKKVERQEPSFKIEPLP